MGLSQRNRVYSMMMLLPSAIDDWEHKLQEMNGNMGKEMQGYPQDSHETLSHESIFSTLVSNAQAEGYTLFTDGDL